MAVYRNLRENYEFRLRYAGKFFIKEMELKRRYREVISTPIRSLRWYLILSSTGRPH